MIKQRKMSLKDIVHQAAISIVPGFDLPNGKQTKKPFTQDIIIKILQIARDFNDQLNHVTSVLSKDPHTPLFSKFFKIDTNVSSDNCVLVLASLRDYCTKRKGLKELIFNKWGIKKGMNPVLMRTRSTPGNHLITKLISTNIFYQNAYSIKH